MLQKNTRSQVQLGHYPSPDLCTVTSLTQEDCSRKSARSGNRPSGPVKALDHKLISLPLGYCTWHGCSYNSASLFIWPCMDSISVFSIISLLDPIYPIWGEYQIQIVCVCLSVCVCVSSDPCPLIDLRCWLTYGAETWCVDRMYPHFIPLRIHCSV